MDANVQVFRTEETCRTALAGITDLKKRYETVAIQDKGRRYNLDLMEAVSSASCSTWPRSWRSAR